jgi:hypothetical protein
MQDYEFESGSSMLSQLYLRLDWMHVQVTLLPEGVKLPFCLCLFVLPRGAITSFHKWTAKSVFFRRRLSRVYSKFPVVM